MKNRKKSTHIRFSPVVVMLLEKLTDKTGLKQTQIVELAVREFAESKGIPIPKQGQKDESSNTGQGEK